MKSFKKITPILLICLLVGILFVGFIKNEFRGISFSIENQTDTQISGLIIKRSTAKDVFNIPTILSNETNKIERLPSDRRKNASDDAMILEYEDTNGIKHTEILIGYLDGVFSAEIFITIVSIDENGKLELDIDVVY